VRVRKRNGTRFRACHPSSRSSNFPDSVFFPQTPPSSTIPIFERASERMRRKSTSTRGSNIFLAVFRRHGISGNYSPSARWHRRRIIRWPYRYSGAYSMPIFRWSIQFPWQLTFQLDTERFARTWDRTCTGCCRLHVLPSWTQHMPARIWISIKPREFPRRIVSRRDGASGEDSLTRFSPDLVQALGGFFFYTRRVTETVGERNRYSPRANDGLLILWRAEEGNIH